ncbi:MAG TPA: hypothetical protein VE732_04235 [Nitrososphaera sp.]|jgi:hypothetical protein|nr:hypothetical protein [Nitrososphaera sp.]
MAEDVVRPEYYGAVGNDSNHDDGPALQAAIKESWRLHCPVALYAKRYYTHQELVLPKSTDKEPTHTVLIGTPIVGGQMTAITAGAPIRSCLTIWETCLIKNVTFDGARLAIYGMYWQGCSNSYFENVGAAGALRDGVFLAANNDKGDLAINDRNTLIEFSTGGNGTLFWGTGSIVPEEKLKPEQVRILGDHSRVPFNLPGATCDLTQGSTLVEFHGVDLLTLNLRKGDPIRAGTGDNKWCGIVQSVIDSSHLTTSIVAPMTATGQDFAIGSGDGWHEMRSGDNNLALMLGGLHRGNGGFALAFDGLYGPTMIGQQIDYHPFWAIRLGSRGGDAVISSSFTKLYFEGLGAGKPFCCVSALAMTVISPLDNNGTPNENIDYPSGPGTAIGVYINREGIQPIGTPDGFKNTLASSNLINAVSDGLAFFGRELAPDPTKPNGYRLEIDAKTPLSGNVAILEPGGVDRVLTGEPTFEHAGGRLVYLQCKGGQPNTVTLIHDPDTGGGPRGTKLKLRSAKVTLAALEGILLFSDGFYWHEVGRTRNSTSNVEIDGPPILRAVIANTIVDRIPIPVKSGLVIVNPVSSITMRATPTFTNGLADGQELTVINKHAANTLTIQDESMLRGSNLRLTAASVKLRAYDSICLLWLGGKWNEISQSHVERSNRP